MERSAPGLNQANAFGAFKKTEKVKEKKDGSDTEEENMDMISVSSYST